MNVPLLDLLVADADCRHGHLYFLPEDDPIGKSLAWYGEWAEAEIGFLSAFIGLGSAVVDVGANIGTHTLAFSRRVGSAGSVQAFEPQSVVFALLERNIAANGCTNVVAVRAGVGRTAGEMFVPAVDYASHVNVGSVALVRAEAAGAQHGGERTPIVALDELELATCHLVKIDAEGMEEDVLAGMAATIQRLRPVIYVECNTVDIGVATLRAIPWSGYRFFLVRTAAYNPSNYRRHKENFFGVARESSILCVPEETLGLMPADSQLCDVIPIGSLQELAQAVLATPRYGDATEFDCDPVRLKEDAAARIAERDRELAAMREELRAAREDIVRLDFRCANLTAQLARAEDTAAEREGEFAAIREKLRAAREDIVRADFRCANLTAQLARAEDTAAERERAITALQASTSWRITAPLRRASHVFRAGLRAAVRGKQ